MINTFLQFTRLCNVNLYMQGCSHRRGMRGARRTMAPPLQFPNQTRSKRFGFKRRGYCFLGEFRNNTDQKFHNFYRMLPFLDSSLTFFERELDHFRLYLLDILSLWVIQKKTTVNRILKDRLHVESWTYW